ncbi:MAG: hypothetical protein HYW26_02585 [Candidatus Aenigmarchaeota archaeon]|nr:hypothetical protein [Candidatus Aenigmarchaeota archaeon]
MNTNPTSRIYEEGSIEYQNGNGVSFYKDKSHEGGNYFFDYRVNGSVIRLNDLLENGRWTFIPVRSNFKICIRENGVIRPVPEIQISIPKLREREIRILSSFHEIGHAKTYDSLHALLCHGSLSGSYSEQLAAVHEFCIKAFGDEEYERFSERFAWTHALKAARSLGLLNYFGSDNVRSHYRLHLGSYGLSFL